MKRERDSRAEPTIKNPSSIFLSLVIFPQNKNKPMRAFDFFSFNRVFGFVFLLKQRFLSLFFFSHFLFFFFLFNKFWNFVIG